MKIPISIPFPASERPKLKFSVSACKLNLVPGDGTSWVEGTYDDPTDSLPCTIEKSCNEAAIIQSKNFWSCIKMFKKAPMFDLSLSAQKPFDLMVEGGAGEKCFELGGLPISSFGLANGAGRFEMSFSKPNPISMEFLKISTGAGSVLLGKLLNAGFKNLKIECGSGSNQIDLTGALKHDCNVDISIGTGSLEIGLPFDIPVAIKSKTSLGGIEMDSGFTTKDGWLVNQAYLANPSPALSISASVALGSLKLRIVKP